MLFRSTPAPPATIKTGCDSITYAWCSYMRVYLPTHTYTHSHTNTRAHTPPPFSALRRSAGRDTSVRGRMTLHLGQAPRVGASENAANSPPLQKHVLTVVSHISTGASPPCSNQAALQGLFMPHPFMFLDVTSSDSSGWPPSCAAPLVLPPLPSASCTG